jgi:hypothetical protein
MARPLKIGIFAWTGPVLGGVTGARVCDRSLSMSGCSQCSPSKARTSQSLFLMALAPRRRRTHGQPSSREAVARSCERRSAKDAARAVTRDAQARLAPRRRRLSELRRQSRSTSLPPPLLGELDRIWSKAPASRRLRREPFNSPSAAAPSGSRVRQPAKARQRGCHRDHADACCAGQRGGCAPRWHQVAVVWRRLVVVPTPSDHVTGRS